MTRCSMKRLSLVEGASQYFSRKEPFVSLTPVNLKNQVTLFATGLSLILLGVHWKLSSAPAMRARPQSSECNFTGFCPEEPRKYSTWIQLEVEENDALLSENGLDEPGKVLDEAMQGVAPEEADEDAEVFDHYEDAEYDEDAEVFDYDPEASDVDPNQGLYVIGPDEGVEGEEMDEVDIHDYFMEKSYYERQLVYEKEIYEQQWQEALEEDKKEKELLEKQKPALEASQQRAEESGYRERSTKSGQVYHIPDLGAGHDGACNEDEAGCM